MYKFFLALIIASTLFSCTQNPYKRDISDVEVTLNVLQFDTDIQALAKNCTPAQIQKMHKTYGYFFETFNAKILQIGMSSSAGYAQRLQAIMQEPYMIDFYKETSIVKKDTTEIYKQLHSALQYYKYYFPKKSIPQITMYTGPGLYNIVVDSNSIAIGLDKYLGANHQLYKELQISNFVRAQLYKERIPVDFARALAEYDYPEPLEEDYLLAHMIQNGRYMFFVKSLLPEVPDSVIWGYTSKQLEFCEKSESEFWKYMASSDDILFNSDYMHLKRFLDDGPFTPIFTKESPGKVGQWLGFKIVESFMKNNPNLTMNDLFAVTSSQEIMRKAKYNP